MRNRLIQLKGDNEAINIYIRKGSISQVLKELESKLESSRAFFEGALVNKIIGESLSYREMKLIEELLSDKFNIAIKDTDILNDIDNEEFQTEEEPEAEKKTSDAPALTESSEIFQAKSSEEVLNAESMNEALKSMTGEMKQETIFLKTTVRSGQVISHEGNIVIIGDVNPGGEVQAEGNIAVFGSVKGVVKAGTKGKRDAFVIAVRLQPTQIAIADLITRMPDDEVYQSTVPEIARIVGNNIVVEEFMRK